MRRLLEANRTIPAICIMKKLSPFNINDFAAAKLK